MISPAKRSRKVYGNGISFCNEAFAGTGLLMGKTAVANARGTMHHDVRKRENGSGFQAKSCR